MFSAERARRGSGFVLRALPAWRSITEPHSLGSGLVTIAVRHGAQALGLLSSRYPVGLSQAVTHYPFSGQTLRNPSSESPVHRLRPLHRERPRSQPRAAPPLRVETKRRKWAAHEV